MYMSTGVEAMKIPDNPPMVNSATKATAFSIGVVKCRSPRHIVPIQLNTLMADGTAITIVAIMKVVPSRGFNAALEHVVAPHDPAEDGDAMMAYTIE